MLCSWEWGPRVSNLPPNTAHSLLSVAQSRWNGAPIPDTITCRSAGLRSADRRSKPPILQDSAVFVLRRALAADLSGDVQIDLAATSLRCTIRLPLATSITNAVNEFGSTCKGPDSLTRSRQRNRIVRHSVYSSSRMNFCWRTRSRAI